MRIYWFQQERLNLDRTLSLILGGVLVTMYAGAAFISYFLIESLGRRNMFLWGSLFQGIGMLLLWTCSITHSQCHFPLFLMDCLTPML